MMGECKRQASDGVGPVHGKNKRVAGGGVEQERNKAEGGGELGGRARVRRMLIERLKQRSAGEVGRTRDDTCDSSVE